MTLSLVETTLYSGKVSLFSGLGPGLSAEADPSGAGLFLVARAPNSSSRLQFSLGSAPSLRRFTACHRYEPFWMKPCAGSRLSEVPPETQQLLIELVDGNWLLLVPLIDEKFRFSLRGKADDSLTLLAETGDSFSPGFGGLGLYLAVGADPFQLLELGARAVHARLGMGKLRQQKPLPDFVDRFGWCTWDAFYQEVSQEKVLDGLARFEAGGVRPRFLILDDGWQSVELRATGERRLTAFEANHKFPQGLAPLVQAAKQKHGIDCFLVWHAVAGYWGGVSGEHLRDYGVVSQTRQFGEGILFHAPTFNQEWWGSVFGLVPASSIARFYDDYHASLAAAGVDGIKVDSQAVLESVAIGQGGRVPLTRAYRAGLEQSAQKHFGGRLINCMSNAQETFYSSPDSTLLRTSVDFWPLLPASHGAHLYTNAQVGLWFGEFMHPDWDMFQSGHEWGAYHAAGRAISGGPVYVSDKPGVHDFSLLRRIVCSDGSVLLCDKPGLPTLDVLCLDPTRDDVLLKIWNTNGAGLAGFVGLFNARVGDGTLPGPSLRGDVSAADVPGLQGEQFVLFRYGAQSLEVLSRTERRELVLGERGFELCSLVPIVDGKAVVGLGDKLNSRGAVVSERREADGTWNIELRDAGAFVAYSERAPSGVSVDGAAVDFEFTAGTKTLRVGVVAKGRCRLSIRF